MVHSLCRAGTVSASLLNGNQQETSASGPADDKGMPKAYNSDKAAEKSAKTYRRQTGKQQASALKKNVCPGIPNLKQRISPNRHYTFAVRHQKAMLCSIGGNRNECNRNQNRRKPKRAAPQNLLEPYTGTLRP